MLVIIHARRDLLAAASLLTAANGLMVLPAASMALWASGNRPATLKWAMAGVVAFALYFIGYVPSPGNAGLLDIFAHR